MKTDELCCSRLPEDPTAGAGLAHPHRELETALLNDPAESGVSRTRRSRTLGAKKKMQAVGLIEPVIPVGKGNWILLVLMGHVVYSSAASDSASLDTIFEDGGLRMIAAGLAMGVDGDALSCPASPVTTPVSLRMVCYVAAFYALVFVLLLVWLLWRKAKWTFYLKRQVRRANLSLGRSPSSSSKSSDGKRNCEPDRPTHDATGDRSYVCVSPILEHGGMFLQQHGYRLSFVGCLVYALLAGSVVVSVILPFLAGFAANSVTPSYRVTKFVPQFLYKRIHGLAAEGLTAGGNTNLDPTAVTASPQCIKLRVYIFAVCFMWCLSWMVVVHGYKNRVRWLLLTPASLAESTHLLVDRKLQKILLLPERRDKNTTGNSGKGQHRGGTELLTERTDLGEPPVTSSIAKVLSLSHGSGRFADTSRIRLAYDPSKGYFLPTATIYEREARSAALCFAGAVEEVQSHGLNERASRNAFLKALSDNLVQPEEVVRRHDADGELGLRWSIRPISTLLLASFLQDEFYLVTLMALWYQAFSLNNLQALILLLLPVFELAFGVYSLRKGEQQLIRIMQGEIAELEKRKTLCVRLKESGFAPPEVMKLKGERKSSGIVLKRARSSEIVPGDIVLLQPGDKVPCDLLLVHGSVSLDESHLTGEAEPVVKVPVGHPSHRESVESFDSDLDPARVAEDEVLDPSSVTGNVVGCIYAGSKIVHTSCRSDLASEMLDDASVAREDPPLVVERKIEDPVALLLEDECCWGVAVRTHGETMRGQLLRQLHLPRIMRFKYHDQFPYVLLLVTLFAVALIAIQTAFTRNLVDTFRFGVEKVLRMLPLYLPALWGICASLSARRLSSGPSSSSLRCPQTYRATAVLPGLLPVAAKIRVVCFDKTGTLTQSTLSLLATHTVANGSFGNLVMYKAEGEAALIGTDHFASGDERDLPLSQSTPPEVGALSPVMRQCLACCNSLHLTAHGMATWTRKQHEAFGDKYVFQAEELRSISEMAPQLSDADIEGVDLEKQALTCSGFNLMEIASASLARAERPFLARATTAWAAEMQKHRKTRQFIVPRNPSHESERQLMLEIVTSYCFDQSTGMMSVIVRECQDTGGCFGQKGYVFCKGRYEEVAKACRGSSVPSDFLACARQYAKGGIYVVGAAYRELTPDELSALDTQEGSIPRAQVESNLCCLGLVLFRNELRTDAGDAIEDLSRGGIRCVMLTGDNPYTAIAVARRARMIRSHAKSQDLGGHEHGRLVEPHPRSKAPTSVLLGNAVLQPHELPLGGSVKTHGVRWTDVNTGEEIEPWRVYYTDEFKELVVTMAAAKVLMKEPDTQLQPVEDAEEDIEDPWKRKVRCEALRDHEERKALLPEKTDWQSETPSLFDRIFYRIRIFSRMSPIGKKLIILHFQRRGLTTCMVGDGSNDSLAIRQADIGVEMGQVQPVPFSAPFAIFHASSQQKSVGAAEHADGKDGVCGLVDIVRMGRCSLSTAMAIYRLHISYGLLSATASLLMVMAQYSGMNTVAGLFLDLVVLLGLSGAMLFSSPISGPLAQKSPTSSPFGTATVLSVLSLVSVDLAALALLLYLFYGPGGFPPPCYWVQSRLREALQNRKDETEKFITNPILEREQMLNKKEVKLREEEKRVRKMKTALEKEVKALVQEEKKLHGESGLLDSRRPLAEQSDPLYSVLGHQIAEGPLSQHLASHWPASRNKDGAQLTQPGRTAESHASLPGGLYSLLESDSVAIPHADAFTPGMPGPALDADMRAWVPPSFFEGILGSSKFTETAHHAGTVCSTDGHAEAALVFVWTGICTLHAAVLFISGNVFRKPAWKNRVLLPFSLLILAFFVSIMLLPPGPMSCVFNINCTRDAANGLRSSPLFTLVQFMAGDPAASILHDASAGLPTLDAVANKAAAEVEGVEATAARGYLPQANMREAAKYMEFREKSLRHLWTDEEATRLSRQFSHALFYMLATTCIVNTLIQFVCLHTGALSEWWRKRHPSLHRGESIPP